jgi:hypothetical protein
MDLGPGVRDQGSEIRDPGKPFSGSRIQAQKRTESRLRIRNTAIQYTAFFSVPKSLLTSFV